MIVLKINAAVNFHNRFDIKVRDKDTGKIKQVGQAENIVLDRIYTRLVARSSYFDNIVFGRGVGELEPTRTTLFNRIGSKAAVNEELIRAYPVTKWTRRVRLEPHEFIGETITEVGVSDHTTSINTHALITDAEGNPLSITKTDTDLIDIYATIYIEFNDVNTYGKFNQIAATNRLMTYLTGGSWFSQSLHLGDMPDPGLGTIGNFLYSKSLAVSSDLDNRRVTYSTRLQTTEGNFDIYEISLGDMFRFSMVESDAWNGYTLKNAEVGVGDGEKTEFELERYADEIQNVKVNGQNANDYTVQFLEKELYAEKLPFWKAVDLTVHSNDPEAFASPFNGTSRSPVGDPPQTFKVKPSYIMGKQVEFVVEGILGSTFTRRIRVYIDGSFDGEEWAELFQATKNSSGRLTQIYTITEPYEYIRFRYGGDGGTAHLILLINNEHKKPKLTFNSPPPEGSVVTADFDVSYIPKTEDFVLDIELSIQFGEGE